MFFSFLFVGLVVVNNHYAKENFSENILDIILDSNLIVLDVLNNGSKEVLSEHIQIVYIDGFNNGIYKYCLDNLIENCSLGNVTQSDYVNSYLSRDFKLFDKNSYIGAIKGEILSKYPENKISILYYLFLLFISIGSVFFLSFIMILINYVTYLLVKFFSWLFDPLSIDNFVNPND